MDDKQSLLMRIQHLEEQVESYRNRMPVSKKERKVIRSQGKMKVISLLGEATSDTYRIGYRPMFSNLWRDVKQQFQVGTLDEILETQFTNAIHYINDWKPPASIEPPQTCLLCEERPGTLRVDESDGKLCISCAQIIGEFGTGAG